MGEKYGIPMDEFEETGESPEETEIITNEKRPVEFEQWVKVRNQLEDQGY